MAFTNGDQIRHGNEIKEEPATFGMKLVGITFNPPGDKRVNKAKELCAQLADLINETPKEGQDEYLFRLIRDNAMNEILNAQMKVVKLLTLIDK